MNRYIIVAREVGVYDGIYYSRCFADRSIDSVRSDWPGVDWAIEESEHGFPVPGLVHLGEEKAKGILKRYQRKAECENE